MDSAIWRTSGGIGKKDDSEKERMKRAHAPCGLCAQPRTQL